MRCQSGDCPADAEWKAKWITPEDPEGFVSCRYLCDVHLHAEASPWIQNNARTRATLEGAIR